MKIGVVGLGYVGSVTAAVLAKMGNIVIGVDIDSAKVEAFRKGAPPIFEPGLSDFISEAGERISFSTSYSELGDAEAVFVCVPTPTVEGHIDIHFVEEACRTLKKLGNRTTIIIKSTVVPGTASMIMKKLGVKIVSNPEFTREGSAIIDTMKPDRIVIGSKDASGFQKARKIWEFTGAPVVETTNENAELIKYASNSFLATKISFINEIANLCEKIPNTDVKTIAYGMGLDRRIGADFLRAGLGYGGSCFPKDTEAIANFARDHGEALTIVESAMKVNSSRERRIADICWYSLGKSLKGVNVCVLGLSFKDDTDDIRESKSIKLIEELREDGAIVRAFDPVVAGNNLNGSCRTHEECLDGSNLAIIATEWNQFSNILQNYDGIVVDARRILDPEKFKRYVGVGRNDSEDS